MLQILRKRTVYAVAFVASCCFTWLGASPAFAQHHKIGCKSCKTCKTCKTTAACPTGTCPAVGHLGCRGQQTNCRPRQDGQPELFYNYYVPGTCGGMPAALYVAPRPVPPVVGQTYFTYQPFMPHELLYQHHRSYYRYYDCGRGLTRTHISWYRAPVSGFVGDMIHHVHLAR